LNGHVTIGITAFNAAHRIKRAVQHAVTQDWPAIDVLIVDDASLDRTAELTHNMCRADSRIRLIRHEHNLGVAAARNSIIDAATGDFVSFFDDDDISDRGRIRAQWSRITAYEQEFAQGAPVVCHTARRQIGADGRSRIEPTMGCRRGLVAPHGEAVAARILWGARVTDGYGAVATCSQMARTSTYRALGGFDPYFRRSEDTEFCVRLALAGGHFVGIEEPLVEQTLTPREDKSLDNELKYKLDLLQKYRHLAPTAGHLATATGFLRFKKAFQEGDRLSALSILSGLLLAHPFLTLDRLSQTRYGGQRPIVSHFKR
jgi:glycosyltransferase involved in cell wall biosynthesis